MLRRLLHAVVAAALAIGLASAPAASAQGAKPTVVLVHGASADGSGWNAVTERLQRLGYPVVAPANPLRTLSGDSAYLRGQLAAVKGPIVLVGHSYGGAVITNAAVGNANVRALVYIAAFAPDAGETVLSLVGKFPGSRLQAALRPVPFTLPDGTAGTDLYVDPARYRQLFTGPTVSARRAAAMAAAQRPATAATGSEPTQGAAWKTIPSWYLVAERDRVIPPAAQRFMARRAKSHVTGIPSAHLAPVAVPAAVAAIVVRAARARG
jgi:pimeloyl-ACP methyl ester carboxylesterase